MKNIHKLLLATVISMVSASSWAIPTIVAGETCGAPDRTATLSSSTSCSYDSAVNFGDTDIDNIFPADSWSKVSELEDPGSFTDGAFSATADNGWGSIPNGGTWSIDQSFWDIYDEAVISMHVGQGGGNPDAWAWLVTPETLNGSWSLSFVDGGSIKGGGLSNLKLWGRKSIAVPEPAVTSLLALGLAAMFATRRKTKT